MGQARRLALLGFERGEEAALGPLVAAAGARIAQRWSVAAEAEAEALLIDIDSMYGQMSWLRAQGGSRPIIALTSSSRADADARVSRPLDKESLAAALQAIGPRLPAVVPGTASAPAAAGSAPKPEPTPAAPAAAAAPLPEPVALPEPEPEPIREPEPPQPRRLVDYLRGGQLPVAVRLRDAEPALVVDPSRASYLGSTALKPLLSLAAQEIEPERWEVISPHEYERLRSASAEQPLPRLLWLAGLGACHGTLLPELTGALRFKLAKYPTAEREFPRHIRIATAMLKQPATPAEIAKGSGQPIEDVIDFINACAAIELVEAEFPQPPSEPSEPAKGGLLGRLRRR